MIQTGLLTTAVLIAGISGPALASTTQGWNHAQPSAQTVPGEQREAASGDVIQPPANVDPGMAVVPPDQHGKMQIIPAPAGPDTTQKGVAPR
jgi:hypothetical protein